MMAFLFSPSSCLLLFSWLLICPLVATEEIFHLRDHSDMQLKNDKDKNIVTTIEKAQEILKRYGYLRCGNGRRRNIGFRYKEGRFGRKCSEEEVRKAIKNYQSIYNIPVTGRLDAVTLNQMSQSRCGNPDDENGATLFKSKFNPKKRHSRRSYNKFPFVRRHRRHLHKLVTRENLIPSDKTINGRKAWLKSYMKDLESGEYEKRLNATFDNVQKKRRNKRSANAGQAFAADVVTWRLISEYYSVQFTGILQRSFLALAFRMWSEVIPLNFEEDMKSPVTNVDILIAFGKGDHLACPSKFDGYGGQLSHAIKMHSGSHAEIHVDDDEHLTINSPAGTNLVKVVVHEVGHALGLFHIFRNDSIMYAIYSKFIPNENFELGWEDRKLVQKIYGTCKVQFHTIFDWVRRREDGRLIYNTYFFKGRNYWMYENQFNRTRYGDPLRIEPEWKGVPDNIDGFVHIWSHRHDKSFFFKGRHYWIYDNNADQTSHDKPKNISSDFRAISGSNFSNIPDNIDSVFFDKRDGNLYFFKGNLVYAYDLRKGKEGCCLSGYPKILQEEFPAVHEKSKLPSHLDAVYYSYNDKAMYFFKGIHYWKNVAYHPLDRRKINRVKGPWLISSRWFDICEVDVEI